MLLSGRNLSKSFGARQLFAGITLGIDDGERVGLIGANGSGKTTLLKILAGQEQPDDGTLEVRRNLRVEYVPQEERFDPDRSCLDLVLDRIDTHLDDHEREIAAQVALGRAGFDEPSKLAGELSGGWRKRLSVVRHLAGDPEVLLMDEPTNHLDVEGVLWLEGLLRGGKFATLIVTHDRRFLEETANRLVELDRSYPNGFLGHDGTYSEFLVKREEFLAAQESREAALKSGVKREIEWLRRGAKARTTKAKGRIERAGQMMDELADVKQRNVHTGAADIDFAASGRRTKKLVELTNVKKSLGGKPLFDAVNVTLSPGSKLGLIGPNGSGKTTLIRLIAGELEPDTGDVFRVDALKVVVFDQHRREVNLDETLRRALFPTGDVLTLNGQPMHVSGWAKKFLFRSDQLDMPVRDLSGGERARVVIARLMLREADVLVLDEPTNDLDIPTLNVLEQSLLGFPGAVVLVTHDRYLLDRVSTELLALDGKGNAHPYADLSQWERAREAARKQAVAPKVKATVVKTPTKRKLTWNEQRELESMEETIHAAEALVADLEQQASDPTLAADHVKAADVYQRLGDAQAEVARLYDRWEALEAVGA
ncbi:MAG: ABC-F family ATP-binding cassette domain-containing protein [Planctomycetota bacterium]